MKLSLTVPKLLGAIATTTMLTTIVPDVASAQVDFGTSSDGPGASLQEQLDDLIPRAEDKIDTVNDETGAETFQTIGKGVTSFLLFEIAGFAPFNTVGLYNSNGDMKELFSGSDAGVTQARINKNELANDGFDEFGLYLTNKNGQTFYSETGRNAGGYDYFLAYQGSDENPIGLRGLTDNNLNDQGGRPRNNLNLRSNDFLFAFEDLPWGSSDKDYNDFVGVIRNVEVADVPEPTTMLGLAAVAGGALALRRRRQTV